MWVRLLCAPVTGGELAAEGLDLLIGGGRELGELGVCLRDRSGGGGGQGGGRGGEEEERRCGRGRCRCIGF